MIPEIKNSRPVNPKEYIRFQCQRCAECCRHVKGAVVLDSLDGYRLAKHFGMKIDDFYLRYGDYFIMDEETHFPLYTLKVIGEREQCVFLENNRCSVRDSRPSTCRMYPFWVEPTSAEGGVKIHYCYERKLHESGKPIRVQQWVRDNLDEEKRNTLSEDYKTITTLAPLLKEARKMGVSVNLLERLLLYYRYLNYDMEQPFLAQFIRNNTDLIKGIKVLIQERK